MSGGSVNILFGHLAPLRLELVPTLPPLHPPHTRLPGVWGPQVPSPSMDRPGGSCLSRHHLPVCPALLWFRHFLPEPSGSGQGTGMRAIWAFEPHPISSLRRQTPACTHRGSWGRRTRVQRRRPGRVPGSCTPEAPQSLPGGGGKRKVRGPSLGLFLWPPCLKTLPRLPSPLPAKMKLTAFKGLEHLEPLSPTAHLSALLSLGSHPTSLLGCSCSKPSLL